MKKYLPSIGINAHKAFACKINTKIKNKVLYRFAKLIKKNKSKIIKQNKKDINFAKKKFLKKNLIDRLELNNNKINQIIKSINNIAKLKDPVDITLDKWKRPNGLLIKKVTMPLGIVGVIYESRPNVTSDISSLCFKSGNCVILRGGSEAFFSNKILANLFRQERSFQIYNDKGNKISYKIMSKAAEKIYKELVNAESQENILNDMQTRDELYNHLSYYKYEKEMDNLLKNNKNE